MNGHPVNPTSVVHVRGVAITFSVANPRLKIWADRFEEIEPELLDAIDELEPGTVFYDAGASIGLFGLYAAIKRGAHVVAFEPEAQNFGTLELNHYLNRRQLARPFQAFCVALADCSGIGEIFTRAYGAGEHVKILDVSETRDTHESFDAAHVQSVIKIPLDEFVRQYALPAPQFLKIDVDSSEAALLRGSRGVLDDPALRAIFIELSDGSDTEERGMLEAHGFSLEQKFPVVRLSGGFYPGLYNCIFRR
jgi:FkbM family methyltransferase